MLNTVNFQNYFLLFCKISFELLKWNWWIALLQYKCADATEVEISVDAVLNKKQILIEEIRRKITIATIADNTNNYPVDNSLKVLLQRAQRHHCSCR